MSIDLALPLLTGFLTSFHCVGMCGPIVTGFVAQRPLAIQLSGASGSVRVAQSIAFHVYYHGGRLISYGTVGMFAGSVGSLGFINAAVQQATSIVFGLAMIAMALFQLTSTSRKSSKREGIVGRILGGVGGSQTGESRFLVGLLTPLLPCGLLYGMAAQAASTGSPVSGAMIMASFALGAIPALAITGIAAAYIGSRLRRIGTLFAAMLIILMGILTIARGFGVLTPISLPGMTTEHLCGKRV